MFTFGPGPAAAAVAGQTRADALGVSADYVPRNCVGRHRRVGWLARAGSAWQEKTVIRRASWGTVGPCSSRLVVAAEALSLLQPLR